MDYSKGTNIEEYAFLSNIATILTKDILIDEKNSRCQPKHFLGHGNQIKNYSYNVEFPLLEQDNDEDMEFFLRQQLSKKKSCTTAATGTAKRVCKKRRRTECEKNSLSSKNFSLVNKTKDVDLLNKFDNVKFEDFLHMNKMSFLRIFKFVRNLLTSYPWPAGITPQSVFSLALWKLTTDEHFEVISRRFEMSLTDCQSLIEQFWHIMSDNYETYIRWPNSQLSQKLQLKGFEQHPRLKIFPHLFGVIVIKRLGIFLASEDAEVPIVLQIVCNADQNVVDCFVELEQDYKFEETPVGQILNLNPNTIPKGSYLVGDKCFPLKSYLMCPFSMPAHRKEHEFNRLLDTALLLAQDTLDAMAKRFNALYALEARDLSEVRKILETICALHNLSVAIEDDYVERKRQVVKFNWSNYGDNIFPVGNSESSVQGLEKRQKILDALIKDTDCE